MKNKFNFIIFLGLIISLVGCQKREIISLPAKIATVSNLKYTLTGDTVVLTWSLPIGHDSLNVTVNDGSNTTQLKLNATSYKYGVVQTNTPYGFTVKVGDTKGNLSLGQTLRFTRAGAAPVTNVSALQNNTGMLLSWTAPASPVTKITLKYGNNSIDLGPTITSYQINNISAGQYIATFVTTNSDNKVSNTVYLPFKVGATMIAYLGTYADSTTLLSTGDDDQKAGAKWLFLNYPKARYISFDKVKNGTIDLSQYRVVWWDLDNDATHALPAIATDGTVISKFTAYYKNGGNFLLSTYAIQYFWTLGRMTNAYSMGFDGGAPSYNPDVWGVGVNIDKKHDQSGHPLYKGITMTTQSDGRISFPVIGAGLKDNHNAIIGNINGYYGFPNDSGNENIYTNFVNDNNLVWLGQWDGVGDYSMAGILELKPKADYQGSGIYIGIGGVEWNGNSGNNPYQSTIQKLYKNAVDYLLTK